MIKSRAWGMALIIIGITALLASCAAGENSRVIVGARLCENATGPSDP